MKRKLVCEERSRKRNEKKGRKNTITEKRDKNEGYRYGTYNREKRKGRKRRPRRQVVRGKEGRPGWAWGTLAHMRGIHQIPLEGTTAGNMNTGGNSSPKKGPQ